MNSSRRHRHSHSRSEHHCHPLEMALLTDRLRRRAMKVTGARQAILGVMHGRPQPLSVREIHAALGGEGCDLVTVYRSMHMLEREGIVKRFDLGVGGARFELLAEGDDGHHHHLVCTGCSTVVEIAECFPDEIERRIASRNGFKKVTHRLEFFGLCPRCQ